MFYKTNPFIIDNSVEQEKYSGKLKYYFSVPIGCNDEANGYGAKWDRKIKHWYVPAGIDLKPFIEKRWKRLSNEEVTNAAKGNEEMDELRKSLNIDFPSPNDSHKQLSISEFKKSRGR